MQELLITLTASGGVIAFGVFLIRGHLIEWKRLQKDDTLSPGDWEHHRRRYQRRMQTSGLIVLLGVMLAFSTEQVPWQRAPRLFGIYIAMLLLMLLWIVLLAMADFWSSKAFNQSAIRQLQRKQRDLEQEATRLRDAHRAQERYQQNGGSHSRRIARDNLGDDLGGTEN